jgi:hypothetical protein
MRIYVVPAHWELQSDLSIDGRGPTITWGRFTSEQVARLVGKGKDGWGGDCRPVKVEQSAVTVYDTVEEYQQGLAANLRAQALAKLSVEEQAALGLRPEALGLATKGSDVGNIEFPEPPTKVATAQYGVAMPIQRVTGDPE